MVREKRSTKDNCCPRGPTPIRQHEGSNPDRPPQQGTFRQRQPQTYAGSNERASNSTHYTSDARESSSASKNKVKSHKQLRKEAIEKIRRRVLTEASKHSMDLAWSLQDDLV